MQYVSTEYREQMQKKARNKSYMRLSMGLINQTAQRGAEIEDGDFTPYSDLKAPFYRDPESISSRQRLQMSLQANIHP